MFLLVPAHPGSSGQRAVKQLCLFADVKRLLKKTIADSVHTPASRLCEEQADRNRLQAFEISVWR